MGRGRLRAGQTRRAQGRAPLLLGGCRAHSRLPGACLAREGRLARHSAGAVRDTRSLHAWPQRTRTSGRWGRQGSWLSPPLYTPHTRPDGRREHTPTRRLETRGGAAVAGPESTRRSTAAPGTPPAPSAHACTGEHAGPQPADGPSTQCPQSPSTHYTEQTRSNHRSDHACRKPGKAGEQCEEGRGVGRPRPQTTPHGSRHTCPPGRDQGEPGARAPRASPLALTKCSSNRINNRTKPLEAGLSPWNLRGPPGAPGREGARRCGQLRPGRTHKPTGGAQAACPRLHTLHTLPCNALTLSVGPTLVSGRRK